MMKRLLLLPLLFATVLVLGQTNMQSSVMDSPKGPIIDNINGNSGTSKEVIKISNTSTLEHTSGLDVGGIGTANSSQQSQQADIKAHVSLQGALVANSPMEDLKLNLRFYPNPAINQLTIELGGQYEVAIALMNVLGQQVYHRQGKMEKATISVSDFPVGSYFLIVMLDGDRLVKRIEVGR